MRRLRWGLVLLICCLLAGGAALKFQRHKPGVLGALTGAVERHLPDALYVAINGGPDVKLRVGDILAEGRGLEHTYRDIWQEKTFPDGRYQGGGAYRRVCPESLKRDDCDFASFGAAIAAAGDGDTLVMSPGVYEEAATISQNRLHIIAEPGAHIKSKTAGGKGALVVRGNGVIVEGLECSDIRVRDRNGACVRLEGQDFTLRGVNFHDSEQGVLSGGDNGLVEIEDSMFNRLGQGGQAHGIYIGPGDTALSVRHSHFINTRNEGHAIKSRAPVNTIRDTVIAALDQVDSRAIDLPEGGRNIITGNIIEEGANSSNWDAIGIGLELRQAADPDDNHTLVEANLFIVDRSSSDLVHMRNVPEARIISNIVVGGGSGALPDGNIYIRSRGLAGLPDFPDLLAHRTAAR